MNQFDYMKFRLMDVHMEEEEEKEPTEDEIQCHFLVNSIEKATVKAEIQPVVQVKMNSPSSMMEPSTPLTTEGSSSKSQSVLSRSQLELEKPIDSSLGENNYEDGI